MSFLKISLTFVFLCNSFENFLHCLRMSPNSSKVFSNFPTVPAFALNFCVITLLQNGLQFILSNFLPNYFQNQCNRSSFLVIFSEVFLKLLNIFTFFKIFSDITSRFSQYFSRIFFTKFPTKCSKNFSELLFNLL